MRFFYNLLFYCLLPFIFLRLLWRARRAPAYRQRWLERLGFVDSFSKPTIWIHAVSLGEAKLAITLLQALRPALPEHHFILTSMTVTGSNFMRAHLGENATHYYIPYDYSGAVKRFLKRIHPQMLVLIETELWPNILYFCGKKNIPIAIANARLGEKSARNYAKVRRLLHPLLKNINLVLAQTRDDALRFAAIGIPDFKIQVAGNLKFDIAPAENLIAQGKLLRSQLQNRPVFIAASTHRGEDEIILAAFAIIKSRIKEMLLILVPRHPERFEEVATLCKQQGFNLARRSKNEIPTNHTDIYLGDTMGELWLLYACADIAFVGGSLIPQGGHNLLEPAALRLPIISGPHLFNFKDIARALEENQALIIVNNANELAASVIELHDHPIEIKNKGEAAATWVEKNQGVLQRQTAYILQLIKNS